MEACLRITKRSRHSAALFTVGFLVLLCAHAETYSDGAVPGIHSSHFVLDPDHPIVGTLESDPARIPALSQAGSRGVVVDVSWDRCETEEGKFDSTYLKSIKRKVEQFRAQGQFVAIDLGVQYPPRWVLSEDSSQFINQDGEPYRAVPGTGDCGVNLVYSEKMREKFEAYATQVFHALEGDIDAVRLGGGRYGELGYPTNQYKGCANCYWAFDPVAQGRQPGLPAGEKPCPVPGWVPGQSSPDHASARQFLDWYLESMRNYHDWQISMVRRYFSGPLFMLYPSTGGLRPGQLLDAINDDANGSTGPEKTGEVGRGFDMARYIAGIKDPQVVVYSTWIDGFEGSEDTSADFKRWSPGHYLASLAAAHQPPLLVGGENTGHPDDISNMEITFNRMRDNHLCVMFWAFEHTLFDDQKPHATLDDFKNCIQRLGANSRSTSGPAKLER